MAAAARDTFTADFDEARRLADDAFVLLNERREQLQQNADASVARLTAASRRKLNALGSKVASLEAAIGDDSQGVSAKERDRRRDMVARLKTHNTQLTELLSRKDAPARAAGGAAAGAPVADERPRETLETAERDELGLLVLQRDVIAAQDAQLDDLSRTVTSVRHIACAVNEELDLQSRLLDDVEDDVENTTGRLIVTTRKIRTLLRKSNNCKLTLCLFFTVVILLAILVLVVKLAPLAALG